MTLITLGPMDLLSLSFPLAYIHFSILLFPVIMVSLMHLDVLHR